MQDATLHGQRILIVEDDEFLQQIYTDLLTGEGYEVAVAREGNEGLARIMEGGWSLILLDMILPNLSGLDILKKMKTTSPKAPNGKVIVASNLDESNDFKEAVSMADGHIIKSNLSPGDLLAKVKSYLAG